ncbi:MAG: C4-type zinc ribbon domain-containing protein [Chthoniobacteraceae bacterium]
MLPEITQLLVLQDRDRKIRQLKLELKRAPLERKELESRTAGTSSALDAAKLKAREVEVKRKELENEAGTLRQKINKYQQQKLETKKNEEYQAITHAIGTIEKEITVIEDQELELMDAAEKQKPVIAAAEKEAVATKTQAERQFADLGAKVKSIEAQLQEIQAERTKLAADVEEDLLDTYQRLFETKDAQAVVALTNEICQGCHVKSQTHVIHAVKAGKTVTTCLYCGRILYPEN